MTLYSAIFRRLAADASVTALVATSAIWQDIAKDDAFPAICIEVEQNSDDAISPRTSLHYDVLITCTALSGDARDAAALAVKNALNRQAWTNSGMSVVSCLLMGAPVSSDAVNGNAEVEYFESEMSFHFIAGV